MTPNIRRIAILIPPCTAPHDGMPDYFDQTQCRALPVPANLPNAFCAALDQHYGYYSD